MTWWHYLLLVNLYLVLFFGFYALLLRRETFFQLNRIYLIGSALLSFFIPLIQAQWVKDLFITRQVQSTIYSTTAPDMIVTFAPLKNNPVTVGEIITLLYAAGAALLAFRLIWQLFEVKKMISRPSKGAYSFFKTVKIQDDIASNPIIYKHEEVHARQWHSADVLLIEAVMIINWFNPVVYLYRFAIKNIHEFIADRQALQTGTNKADYALLLLSQTFSSPVHNLVNPFFNHSLLKQRIMMLQKNKSQRIKLAKYGLSAPLFILMLVLSSATISDSKAINTINKKTDAVFAKPATIIIEEPVAASPTISLEATIPKNAFGKSEFKAPELVKTDMADTTLDKGKVYTAVDHLPGFIGGDNAFGQYLGRNIRYPKDAREKNIQGRVIAKFIVEPDGKLTNIRIVRGIGYGCDEETIRVLNLSPKWKPGTQKGKAVRVEYAVPVQFALEKTTVITYTPKKGDKLLPPTSAMIAENKTEVFTAVEHSPVFPGGDKAFGQYLAKSVRYPAKARENKIQGRVIVTFIVEEDGAITNARVVRGIGGGADEEALRIISASPKWVAGVQNGHNVRVQYTVPINFALAQTESKIGAIKINRNDDVESITYKPTDSTKQTVRIRGNDLSINPPLYILDGKEITDLTLVKPDDIQSISVLKDKSATALYGFKGINGVVLVQTKAAKLIKK
ncbi:M56 family metallopeptidase [Mucilaginibacter glaciei]|uniref:TonB family protein n=1 Tax=Mucilaginibacter glaciei TaxID=2772109 RepID=A0A926NL05_9SPHI|nr:M56 family metallopeptidase [Mucilaginibacter glaciei]MBD1394019.1 TonB family protein [Mucilaginibacter glaciei]